MDESRVAAVDVGLWRAVDAASVVQNVFGRGGFLAMPSEPLSATSKSRAEEGWRAKPPLLFKMTVASAGSPPQFVLRTIKSIWQFGVAADPKRCQQKIGFRRAGPAATWSGPVRRGPTRLGRHVF